MTSSVATTAQNRRRRRRRAFSLNGLAIQLSAFALSFTLVALLVVSGSQAAFVEENQVVTNHVPLGLPGDVRGDDGGPAHRPRSAPASSATPSPAPSPASSPAPSSGPSTVPAEEAPADPGPAPRIELTDDDADTAMFSGDTVLAPGTTHSRCLTVAYTGQADPAGVLLYAAQVSGDLAPYLDLVVELGPATDDPFRSCAGFVPTATVYSGTLADFAAAHPDYASGVATWTPDDARDARSFRFSLSVRDAPAAEGKAASFGFTWQVRTVG
jgi:hypothetical protein